MVIVEKRVDGVVRAELSRFLRRAQPLAKVGGEVDVLITGNSRVKELNRRFRGKNKPTDVLSFPRAEGGDIAISVDMARENALRHGHRTLDEIKILVLHGLLHLAGHDHETDDGRMAAEEARLRARLRLPGSLIARTQIARTQIGRTQIERTQDGRGKARTANSAAKKSPRQRRSRP
jgi:probable rRNA maturation factor